VVAVAGLYYAFTVMAPSYSTIAPAGAGYQNIEAPYGYQQPVSIAALTLVQPRTGNNLNAVFTATLENSGNSSLSSPPTITLPGLTVTPAANSTAFPLAPAHQAPYKGTATGACTVGTPYLVVVTSGGSSVTTSVTCSPGT
jgi:hypothetical protein